LSVFTLAGGIPARAGDALLDGFHEERPAADDDLLEGFEDSTTAMDNGTQETTPGAGKDAPVRLGGHVKAAASYNFAHEPPAAGETDWRGLSRLKTALLLALDLRPADSWRAFVSGAGDYDFAYGINGRDDYTDAVLDDYESEVELREAYLQGSLSGHIDIKLGRQIVVWGTSDNIRVVDVINPLDLREPGITDIEDLRLPITLTKLDYYWGPFNLSGMAIHEVRFDKNPAFGSDFYPLEVPGPPEDIPESNLRNTQLAASLTGIFSGWDLGFYWADLYNADAHVEISPEILPVVRRKHARVKMVGGSTNVALGNWLIKAEAAYFDGLKFTAVPNKRFSSLDVMAGLEYAGFTDTRMTLEIADQHLFDHESVLKEDPDGRKADQLHWVARLDKDLMNDTLTLTLLVSVYGERGQDGAYQRLSAEYEIKDAFTVDGGVTLYQSGDLPAFKTIGDNDRFFLEFKYSF
jgi:hypothetical protein